MRRNTVPALSLCLLLAGTGCASLLPTSHESFGEWLVGEPDGDYEIVDLQGRAPELQMAQAYVAWPLFAARDGVRIGLSPLVAPYYLFAGEGWERPRRSEEAEY
jgi:hypothetical protein